METEHHTEIAGLRPTVTASLGSRWGEFRVIGRMGAAWSWAPPARGPRGPGVPWWCGPTRVWGRLGWRWGRLQGQNLRTACCLTCGRMMKGRNQKRPFLQPRSSKETWDGA